MIHMVTVMHLLLVCAPHADTIPHCRSSSSVTIGPPSPSECASSPPHLHGSTCNARPSRHVTPAARIHGKMQPALVVRDLVLVGGGHAHVHVIRMWAMRPVPGVRVTLVTRDVETPYSGMLPGLVGGVYTHGEAHIDLVRLCAWARVRLVHASATGLLLDKKCVLLDGQRPPLAYDLLSLDVGITPAVNSVTGASQHAVAVKPIDGFAARWTQLAQQLAASPAAAGPGRVTVVGGGAGGVELALAMASAFRTAGSLTVSLVTKGEVLPTHSKGARDRISAALRARHIAVYSHVAVVSITQEAVALSDGRVLESGACVWCTDGSAPPWLAASGIATDAAGCVTVGATLRSVSHADVFAAGDCAHLGASPRPKAGVFAVRAGPVLYANLRAALHGRPLTSWTPQTRHLALLNLGDGTAVASWGRMAVGGDNAVGRLMWRWKDRIDRKWMRMCVTTWPCGSVLLHITDTRVHYLHQVSSPAPHEDASHPASAVCCAARRRRQRRPRSRGCQHPHAVRRLRRQGGRHRAVPSSGQAGRGGCDWRRRRGGGAAVRSRWPCQRGGVGRLFQELRR